jgi:hypothetical protein
MLEPIRALLASRALEIFHLPQENRKLLCTYLSQTLNSQLLYVTGQVDFKGQWIYKCSGTVEGLFIN